MPAHALRADNRVFAGATLVSVGSLLRGLGRILLAISSSFGTPIATPFLGIGAVLAVVGFLERPVVRG